MSENDEEITKATRNPLFCHQSRDARPLNKRLACPVASVGLGSVPSQSAVLVHSCGFRSVGRSEWISQSRGSSAAGVNS